MSRAARTAALGPFDMVAAHILTVARMHRLARAAAAVAQHRLRDIALRQRDVLALLHVFNAATGHSAPDGIAYLPPEAPQKTFAVTD